MIILSLDTSTQMGTVALSRDRTVLSFREIKTQRSHSEHLNIFINECMETAGLTLKDIDFFASDNGPGSFTGIRIATNAAKTLAYAFNKPIVSVDSLTILATGLANNINALGELSNLSHLRPIVSMINAYKNMIYFGVHNPKGQCILSPTVLTIPEINNRLVSEILRDPSLGAWVVGDGFDAYSKYFSEDVHKCLVRFPVDGLVGEINKKLDYPHACTLAQLANDLAVSGQTKEWKMCNPLYIRASEAEETKKGIVYKALI